MSDFIEDVDDHLLGLFEDYDEVLTMALLYILNSIDSVPSIRREPWNYQRIDVSEHIERRLYDNSFSRSYRMDMNAFMVLYELLFPYIDHDMSFSRAGTPITKVMIVLAGVRYMAGARYDSLQDIIGTNPRTIYKLRDKFVDAVLSCPELRIEYPTDLGIVMEGFTAKSRDGILNKCIGCIDGCFQATTAPSKKEVDNNQLAYYCWTSGTSGTRIEEES